MYITLAVLALVAAKVEEVEPGKTWHVTVDAIPKTVDELVAVRDQVATTPQGAIAVFILAAAMYGEDATSGEQAMIVAVDASNLAETQKGSKRPEYKGYQLGARMVQNVTGSSFDRGKAYYAKGYVQGTKADDGYKLPAAPYKIVVTKHTQQPADPSKWKGLSPTSGADNPKPFDVIKNSKGVWKVDNPSSFFAGCKPPPVVKKSDDL